METNERNRELTITVEKSVENATVRVADTGHGVSHDIRDRIMESFIMTKQVGKGTGLGLSITYGTITKHKGQITFESEIGKGTEFLIQFPASNRKQEG